MKLAKWFFVAGAAAILFCTTVFIVARSNQIRWNDEAEREFEGLCSQRSFVNETNRQEWEYVNRAIDDGGDPDEIISAWFVNDIGKEPVARNLFYKEKRIFEQKIAVSVEGKEPFFVNSPVLRNIDHVIRPSLLTDGLIFKSCLSISNDRTARLIRSNLELRFE